MPKVYRAANHPYRSNSIPNVAQAESAPNGNRDNKVWSADEDQTLLDARASGMNWTPIAVKYFAPKSGNACRKRHERLMERRNAENWGGIKAETLAMEYMKLRASLWKPLADALGEKWQVIEEKVCFIISAPPIQLFLLQKPKLSVLVHGERTQEPTSIR